jgi:hypothetical protein
MLVLESKDAKSDKGAFDAAGIGGFETFFFERKGLRPDGTPVEVSFTLAFAQDGLAQQCGFFVCQQHRPENFWNKVAQQHLNGASALRGVSMVADEPSDHAEFMRAFTGIDEFSATSAGLRFVTPRGELDVLSSAAFAFEYHQPPSSGKPQLAAFSVAVPDLEAMKQRLVEASIPFDEVKDTLVIPAVHAFGTVIRFIKH